MGRGASLQLARLFGIRIGVDFSWFVVLFIAIFLLQDSFKATIDGSESTAFVAAVAAALLFFGSIIFHELGHALAARREGIQVTGIDLFLFGGLTHFSRDTDTPGAEFRVSAAGPLATVVVIVVCGAIGIGLEGWDRFWQVAGLSGDATAGVALLLLSFLVPMNLALLIFNLVPAYPLDGGRMARAIVWKVTGDRAKATRAAALVGTGFGWLLIALGIALAVSGSVFNGVWLAVLGWLVSQSARGAMMQSAVTARLEGVTVEDVMDSEPVTIPAELPVARAYDEFFLRYQGWEWFAVVEADGRYVGRVDRRPVEEAALGGGGSDDRLVRELAVADDEARVRSDTPLEALLGSEPLRRLGVLMAVDGEGRLRGVVTVEQVTRALRAHLARA